MAITTITSREFNQDVSRAKRAAKKGPVIVTGRGKTLACAAEHRPIPQAERPRKKHR
jgi:hypothetical protein